MAAGTAAGQEVLRDVFGSVAAGEPNTLVKILDAIAAAVSAAAGDNAGSRPAR